MSPIFGCYCTNGREKGGTGVEVVPVQRCTRPRTDRGTTGEEGERWIE